MAADAQARFHTRSGRLLAERRAIGSRWISRPRLAESAEPPADLFSALGLTPVYVGRNQFDYLVEVESAAGIARRAAGSRHPAETAGARHHRHGAVRYARIRFHLALFAPGAGVDEDPVTGSAHTCLGPYWSKRLGKTRVRAYQASARGGMVRVRCAGIASFTCGQAVTVLRGELNA